jgi:DNA-binding beta-propeller fold protein YncE
MSRRIAALLAFGLVLTANTASAYRAFVVESDFATGSFGTVNTNTRAQACDLMSPHSDARVRARGNRAYIVNRFGADNITVFDATTQSVVRQFSVGNGANPYDIEFSSAAGAKAYVTRYETADLWAVDVNLGTHTGTISLAAFADADGIPEMDQMARVGDHVHHHHQRGVGRDVARHAIQSLQRDEQVVADTRHLVHLGDAVGIRERGE